jgi:hypothetical protein
MESRSAGLSLTQANMQAQKPYRTDSNLNMSSSQQHSVANSVLGDLLPPNAMATGANLYKYSKRNSVSSTVDHYAHSHAKSVRLENTYRLGPSDAQRFNGSRVRKLMGEILKNHLENCKYEPSRCKDMCELLSEEIKARTKSIVYKRYKVIVNVTIGQNFGNSVFVASRSLWNTETDNECTVTFNNSSLYAVATVYACYCD